jgi:glycine reductase
MRLTWQIHRVAEVGWGTATSLQAGRLTVSREQLLPELLADPRLASLDLQLVRPYESCRLVPVFDVVEPRAKLDPEGADFPGALTPVRPVGMGTTRVLRGLAVTVLDPAPATAETAHVLDSSTSDTRTGRYAGLWHLALVPALREGLSTDERRNALRLLSLRAASLLARLAGNGRPDAEEHFELTAVDPALPRVAYVYQLHSHQRPTMPGEPLLYGDNCRHLLPTLLHPNEILDGAVVRTYVGRAMETYGIQNHAVVLDLYKRHGRDVSFAGVVVYVANELPEEKQRAPIFIANLVRHALRADGAIFTKSGGGAPHVDMAIAAERCEQLGVKTAVTVYAQAGEEGDTDSATLFNSPLLNAIVCVASRDFAFDLPPVERVIAPSAELAERYQGRVSSNVMRTVGTVDQLGGTAFTAAMY